ncbi:MAG: hypothetical protein JNK05_12335 [Myxococcales bacterium]|nr:hypothetical protein [Myxococcales bacterium]
MANWSNVQLECLKKIYLDILGQPSQMTDEGYPKEGSRLHTLHANAYSIYFADNASATQPVTLYERKEAIYNLTTLFTLLDPSFPTVFKEPERDVLFAALSNVVGNSKNRQSAPYNVPSTGLIY